RRSGGASDALSRPVGALALRRFSASRGATALMRREQLRLRRLRGRRNELLNLPDGVVDLHVECLLAERGGRLAPVTRDAVVLARRRVGIRVAAPPAALAGWRHR